MPSFHWLSSSDGRADRRFWVNRRTFLMCGPEIALCRGYVLEMAAAAVSLSRAGRRTGALERSVHRGFFTRARHGADPFGVRDQRASACDFKHGRVTEPRLRQAP